MGTCWELNCEILRNAGHFGPGLIDLGCFIQFRGWVVSDLVGGSFRPIFRVISVFGCFGQRLKVIIICVCIIICV